MPNSMRRLEIDVVSDVMCPWCYIGKRKLEAALDARPRVHADVRWRPYQLDATIPREGMDRKVYLARKFGAERASDIYRSIQEAGAQFAIPFAFDRITKSPNTLNAHRVIRWAATAGVQEAVVELLFEAYFVSGADLSDPEILADLAAEAGMEREIVARLLSGSADEDLVTQEYQMAQSMGVQGVPCFIFANKYVVMGAQDPEVLVQAIDRALSDEAGETKATGTA